VIGPRFGRTLILNLRDGRVWLSQRGDAVCREETHAEGWAVMEEEVREGLVADVDG
jgi:hypothetical protein